MVDIREDVAAKFCQVALHTSDYNCCSIIAHPKAWQSCSAIDPHIDWAGSCSIAVGLQAFHSSGTGVAVVLLLPLLLGLRVQVECLKLILPRPLRDGSPGCLNTVCVGSWR